MPIAISARMVDSMLGRVRRVGKMWVSEHRRSLLAGAAAAALGLLAARVR
jgi:hypothetical protein